MDEKGRVVTSLPLPVGKLPHDILDRMLKTYTSPGARIVVGPSIGEDATAVDMGDRYLLIKTDPITFVDEDIGTYTVKINANDIAVMGGKPLWLLTSILLPEDRTTTELVEKVFRQLSNACKEIGVSLCGGHTEIVTGLDRIIVVGAMAGEVEKSGLITTAGACAGDDILLTKAIAIEGTSIISRHKEAELNAIFDSRFVRKCKGLTEVPGISILKDAELATRSGRIHSMHDPTEGGLATGLHEIAFAADAGIFIEAQYIPILPECESLCQHYHLDPLGLIASGSLLVTLPPQYTETVIEELNRSNIPAVWIGKVVPREEGVKIKRRNEVVDLPSFRRDEITKLFS